MSTCCATDTMVATRASENNPLAYRCGVDHIREAAWEALADLASTDLSRDGEVRARPEFWVGQLEYLLGALLIATETEQS